MDYKYNSITIHGTPAQVFNVLINYDLAFEDIQAEALALVYYWADDREDTLDAKLSESPTRAMFWNSEIVQYFNDGRPATPSGNVYVMANSRAIRKNIPLRTVLENKLARWISVRAMIATLDDASEEAIEAIEAATTVEEVAAVLESLP